MSFVNIFNFEDNFRHVVKGQRLQLIGMVSSTRALTVDADIIFVFVFRNKWRKLELVVTFAFVKWLDQFAVISYFNFNTNVEIAFQIRDDLEVEISRVNEKLSVFGCEITKKDKTSINNRK